VRIGLDIRWLHRALARTDGPPLLGGIGIYIRDITSSLLEQGAAHEFVLLCSEGLSLRPVETLYGDARNAELVQIPPALSTSRWDALVGSYLRQVQGNLQIRGRVGASNLDLYHSLSQFDHAYAPAGVLRVVTIHDVAPLVLADGRMRRAAWLRHLRSFADYDAVITDSESTRRDVVAMLGVTRGRSETVPLGCPLTSPEAGIPPIQGPYILYVGGLSPNKNVLSLLRAWAQVVARGAGGHRLVLAGASRDIYPDRFAEMERLIEELGLKGSLEILQFVADEQMSALYAGATAFVLPSIYEGFGLPLVEAMAAGCPVIAVDVSSIPEIVGDAAILCPDGRPDSLAAALIQVLQDAGLRETLRERGLGRAREFSWDAAARACLNIYGRIAEAA
jgi:glycosyltransferase involved in cell wall biosynthesis